MVPFFYGQLQGIAIFYIHGSGHFATGQQNKGAIGKHPIHIKYKSGYVVKKVEQLVVF
jgi:hypothetical protein